MRQTVRYTQESQEGRDRAALRDLEDWMGPERMRIMIESGCEKFETVIMLFGIAGVEGLPVMAFGRRYTPEIYQAWVEERESEAAS